MVLGSRICESFMLIRAGVVRANVATREISSKVSLKNKRVTSQSKYCSIPNYVMRMKAI